MQSLHVGLIQSKGERKFTFIGSCPLLFNEQTITWAHNLTADDAVLSIQASDITICGIHRLNNNIIMI